MHRGGRRFRPGEGRGRRLVRRQVWLLRLGPVGLGAVLRWRRSWCRDTCRMIRSSSASSSAPAGYRFPRGVIAVAVRWYLRYGLSYRDVEELLAERGIEVDQVTVYRWVQTF